MRLIGCARILRRVRRSVIDEKSDQIGHAQTPRWLSLLLVLGIVAILAPSVRGAEPLAEQEAHAIGIEAIYLPLSAGNDGDDPKGLHQH